MVSESSRVFRGLTLSIMGTYEKNTLMTYLQSNISVAKTNMDRDMAQARQRAADTLQTTDAQLQDKGLVNDLARLICLRIQE